MSSTEFLTSLYSAGSKDHRLENHLQSSNNERISFYKATTVPVEPRSRTARFSGE